jgi:hypothetical protein
MAGAPFVFGWLGIGLVVLTGAVGGLATFLGLAIGTVPERPHPGLLVLLAGVIITAGPVGLLAAAAERDPEAPAILTVGWGGLLLLLLTGAFGALGTRAFLVTLRFPWEPPWRLVILFGVVLPSLTTVGTVALSRR